MILKEAIRFIPVCLSRFSKYLYCMFFKRSEFVFNEHSYKYFCSLFNNTFECERAVEVPIVLDCVKRFPDKEILELGNVLHSYYKFKHDIVDKYEKKRGVINQDIVEYRVNKKYGLIVSISTLEHIGYDEEPKDKNKVLSAIENMINLLDKKGIMVVTWPLGYNKDFDSLIEKIKLKFSEIYYLKRISKDNRWIQAGFNEIKDCRFNFPYPFANAIAVGVFKG